MRLDIVIDRKGRPQRVVIDTKFTNVHGPGWYWDQSLRTGYVYQLCAYLRSQERHHDPRASSADGLLLHPRSMAASTKRCGSRGIACVSPRWIWLAATHPPALGDGPVL